VADEPIDPQKLSKRERQKLRREQKRQAQKAQAARARARQVAIYGLIAAVVLAGVGWAGYGWWSDRQERERLIAEAAERLGELGCTEVQEMPNLGAGHFTDTAQMAEMPPDVVYPDRPTTSGTHIGQWALTGVYDKVIDERLLVHNLEHGYVNIFYTDEATDDQVEELKAAAEDWVDGRYQKVIVSRWKADMPGDARFGFTAWDFRQLCRDFDEGVALAFLEDHHHLAGRAPERTVAAHTDPDQPGTIDPGTVEGDLLFPPLAELEGEPPAATPEPDAMEDG
jgi:hypothetical protein